MIKEWEKYRLPESAETERRFSDCLEELTDGKYYVIAVGRGVEGIELPPEGTLDIDYGVARNTEDNVEFLGFIDIVGRNCEINSFPDYVVRRYKVEFAKKALEYRIPTFIVQEMKLEKAPLPNRYIWIECERIIMDYENTLKQDFMGGKPQWNYHVPLKAWHIGLESFIKHIDKLPDVWELYNEYIGDLICYSAYAGIIDE